MEKNILKLKGEINFCGYKIYSICMRGARLWDKTKELLIYTNGNGELIDTAIKVEPNHRAIIVSQKQFVFTQIDEKHCFDNYDKEARHKMALLLAMATAYPDFDRNEIVTILSFDLSSDDINS